MDDWMKGMTDFQRDSVARLASRQKSCQMRFNSLCRDEREWKEEHKKLLAERDALKQRVAELESQEFTLPHDPFRDPDRDLRERLVCAAFAGLAAHPSDDHPMRHLRELAEKSVNAADAMLAAMRKGESDDK